MCFYFFIFHKYLIFACVEYCITYRHLLIMMQSREERRAESPSGLVLTTDPKPRLRWTAELHERFVDAVTHLGGPDSTFSSSLSFLLLLHSFVLICMYVCSIVCGWWLFTLIVNINYNCDIISTEATPKTIMRVMAVKGLTLYHLKSHLQVSVLLHTSFFLLYCSCVPS